MQDRETVIGPCGKRLANFFLLQHCRKTSDGTHLTDGLAIGNECDNFKKYRPGPLSLDFQTLLLLEIDHRLYHRHSQFRKT
jgi:hypothetical protein